MWPNEKRLELDPPSDHSIDVSQRAEFNGLLSRVVPCRVFVFGVFRPQSADRPKKSPHFSTSNTTTAHTQMGLLVVGVQGHQKNIGKQQNPYENRRFCGSGGAGTRGLPGGLRSPGPPRGRLGLLGRLRRGGDPAQPAGGGRFFKVPGNLGY